MAQPQALVVLVTASGPEEAEQLARVLLDQHLIACATIIPHIRSLFRWEDRLECHEESLLVIKTTGEFLAPLTDQVKQHHSYAVPEIVALPIVGGSTEYLSWVANEVSPGEVAHGT